MLCAHESERNHAAQRRELTAEEWIKLAKEAKKHGMLFALLTGGRTVLRRMTYETMRLTDLMCQSKNNSREDV